MDIYTVLRREHELIKDLLVQLERNGSSSNEQQKLLTKFRSEFLSHSKTEEDVFYKALVERDETFADNIERSKEEHTHVEKLISQLSNSKTDNKWREILQEIRENLEAHIDTEEMQVFSVAESNFSEAESRALATQFKAMKKLHKNDVPHPGDAAA